jgi:alginate O-acetyltransferase complex protein AlgJ
MHHLAHGGKIMISRRGALAGFGTALTMSMAPSAAHAVIVNLVVIGKDGWLFPIWDEVRHVDLKRLKPVVDVLAQAVGIMKKANIQVVFALTPVKSRVYQDMLPDDFKFAPDPERRYTESLAQLRALGTLVPDLNAPLVALRKAQPTQPVFFKADTHWSASGAEAAATAMAKDMREKLKLPPSAQPGTKLGAPTTMTQEKNDLAALLPPAEAVKYQLETYPLRSAAPAYGSGLLDDELADVVVVGNSFMQPRLGFSAMLSNQLGRPVQLVWKVHQYGPYQTLLSYFASDAFKRRKPAVIVWNSHETDMNVPSNSRDVWGQNLIAPQAFLDAVRKAVGG